MSPLSILNRSNPRHFSQKRGRGSKITEEQTFQLMRLMFGRIFSSPYDRREEEGNRRREESITRRYRHIYIYIGYFCFIPLEVIIYISFAPILHLFSSSSCIYLSTTSSHCKASPASSFRRHRIFGEKTMVQNFLLSHG